MLANFPPQTLTSDQVKSIHLAARGEGWKLVADEGLGGSLHIEHRVGYEGFSGDDKAIAFVNNLALNGSLLHKIAIMQHSMTVFGSHDHITAMGVPHLLESSIDQVDQLAQSEGWLFGTVDDCDTEVFRISKLDDSATFASDAEAYRFVTSKAAAGSVLHRMALSAHGQSRHSVTGMRPVKAKVEIDITYLLPPSMSPDDVEEILKDNIDRFIGNGGLTGDSDAMTDSYDVKVEAGR